MGAGKNHHAFINILLEKTDHMPDLADGDAEGAICFRRSGIYFFMKVKAREQKASLQSSEKIFRPL